MNLSSFASLRGETDAHLDLPSWLRLRSLQAEPLGTDPPSMERGRRNRLLIGGIVILTAASFVAVVLVGPRISDRPGFGLVGLLLLIAWFLLARYLLGVAHRLRAENAGRYPPPPGEAPADSGRDPGKSGRPGVERP